MNSANANMKNVPVVEPDVKPLKVREQLLPDPTLGAFRNHVREPVANAGEHRRDDARDEDRSGPGESRADVVGGDPPVDRQLRELRYGHASGHPDEPCDRAGEKTHALLTGELPEQPDTGAVPHGSAAANDATRESRRGHGWGGAGRE